MVEVMVDVVGEPEMEPGDVLVRDVMVVHRSAAVSGNRLRRTPHLVDSRKSM